MGRRGKTPSRELSPAATELLTWEGLTKARAGDLKLPGPPKRYDTSQPAARTTQRGAESSLRGFPRPS